VTPRPCAAGHHADLLRQMVLIRRFEEQCVELYSAGEIHGFVHLYIGEEAVAVGVNQALTPDDSIVSTYREHGHALVRGIPINAVMAEMYGKSTGCSGGRGGSMHLFDVKTRTLLRRERDRRRRAAARGGPCPRRPDARRLPGDGLLLRRWRGGRG